MKEKEDEDIDIQNENDENKEDNEDEENKIIENGDKDKDKKESNEKAELKLLDLNEQNEEFDENLHFNHYYLAQRQMDLEPIITGNAFPYIMSREFLYSYFEDKKNYKNATNETYPQILGRVKQFTNSNDDNFNKIFLNNIKKYTEFLGKEKSSTIIIPVLSKIVGDKINTKIHFLIILESYIEYLKDMGEDGLLIIKNNILNIFKELYRDKFNPNKSTTPNKNYIITPEQQKQYDSLLFERFIQLSKILIKTEFKEFTFNFTLDFAKIKVEDKEQMAEKKILCIKILTNLTADFGEEFTKESILPVLDKFMQEENVKIKEETALSLITLIKLLNIEFIGDYVLDSIEKISNDKIWMVRKKCIEVLYKIIYELKNKYKKENNEYDKASKYASKIISLIENFIEDKKKKVRMFLIEKLGEIIKPLDKNELSEKLFDFYAKTVDDYYSNENNQVIINSLNSENKKNLNYYFAYNFPAVLLYYGSEYWKQLKSIYINLCNDEDLQVRSSIIASFYEVSKILGKEITQKELLPLYDKFLENEKCSYTKVMSEKYLPQILSNLDKEVIDNYNKNNKIGFNSIVTNDTAVLNKLNKNKKIEYLKNILTYYTLYDNDTIYNDILSKCIFFSMDSIYKVRTTSCKIMAELIMYLYHKDYKKENLTKLFQAYAFNKKCKQRINFIKISKAILLKDDIIYIEKLKEILFTLANKEYNFDVLVAMTKALIKVVTDKDSKCREDTSVHYLCKKINTGKILSVTILFKNVQLKKNEKLEVVGSLPEGNVFTQDNTFFKEEFRVEINKKKNNDNMIINNEDDEENKYIN